METSPALRIRSLKKAYYSKVVLNNIDLEIEPGQIIGYIGPNGAGKSTTLRILGGLDFAFDGEVEVLGMDVKKNPLEVKARIGFLPEQAALYEQLTPIEFYELVGGLHKLPWAKVESRARQLENYLQLSYNRNQRMETFSKGMRQKVLLTSTLLHDPDLILLDEPLDGLDANTVIRVKNLLGQLAEEGKTIFYSSHIMDVVERISHRIILLNGGHIVANGSFAELQRKAKQGNLESLFAELTGGVTDSSLPRFQLDRDE
ncbi:MAG: ABC transporter ATP-binding protein [Bacteroidota bacterium]